MTKIKTGTADATNTGNAKMIKIIKQSNINDNYKVQINFVKKAPAKQKSIK